MIQIVVPLVLNLVVLAVAVAGYRKPAWFVDRSPATKHDPTVDRDVFISKVHRMGLWLAVIGGVLVSVELIFLVAHLAS